MFGLSGIQLGIGGAVVAVVVGLGLYARDADQAFVREKTRAALLEGAVDRLNKTVQAYDEQRDKDQRQLDELARREQARSRELDRIREEYDRLLAGLAQRIKSDPRGLAADLRGRLLDLLRRTGEDRDRGAVEADRHAAPAAPR